MQAMKQMISDWATLLCQFLAIRAEERKTLFLLVLLNALYVFPILLADDAYVDDLGRSIYGYTGGKANGRPFADMVMGLVSFGKPIQDTAPLSQLLAVLLLSYTMILLARTYYASVSCPLLVGCLALAIMPPFLLENLSYHFDAVTMILALCIGLSCYAVPEDWGRRERFLYGAAAAFLVLGLYQAAIGAYLSMAFVEAICPRGEDKRKRMMERFAALLLAGVLYKIMCAFVVQLDSYSGAHAQMVFPVTQEGLGIFLKNLASFGGWFGLAFDSTPRLVTFIVFGLLAYGFWIFWRKKQGLRYLVALAGMLLGTILPQLFLREPVFAARVMISCVVLAIFLGILMSFVIRQKRMAALLLIPLLFSGYAGAYAYANVLHAQSDANRRIAQQLVTDIGRLNLDSEKNDIVVFGQSPAARERQLAEKRRPIIAAMTPIYLSGDWMWGGVLMNHFSNREFHIIRAEDGDRSCREQQPDVARDIYRIYSRDNHFVVDFEWERP